MTTSIIVITLIGLTIAFGGYYLGGGSHSAIAPIGIFIGLAGLFIYSFGFFKHLASRKEQTLKKESDGNSAEL